MHGSELCNTERSMRDVMLMIQLGHESGVGSLCLELLMKGISHGRCLKAGLATYIQTDWGQMPLS